MVQFLHAGDAIIRQSQKNRARKQQLPFAETPDRLSVSHAPFIGPTCVRITPPNQQSRVKLFGEASV
jgi:hypothetical protein